jgi:hypothetical protein
VMTYHSHHCCHIYYHRLVPHEFGCALANFVLEDRPCGNVI